MNLDYAAALTCPEQSLFIKLCCALFWGGGGGWDVSGQETSVPAGSHTQ